MLKAMVGARVAFAFALMAALAGCNSPDRVAEGRRLVAQVGCTGCHVIPGAQPPYGSVGPSLAGFGAKPTIAGVVPNTRDNLASWLVNPARLKPGTLMPGARLTPAEVDAIVAYLETLKSPS